LKITYIKKFKTQVKEEILYKRIKNGMDSTAPSLLLLFTNRIKSGVDAAGGRFKELSKPYKKRKEKMGKHNMFEFSGKLIKNITYSKAMINRSRKTITLNFFIRKNQLKKAGWVSEIRNFFEFSRAEISKFWSNI